MKRICVLIITFLSLMPICALTYESNLIGQKLRNVTSLPDSGYAIQENGDESILYLDGKAVSRTERLSSGDDIIETCTELSSGKTRVKVYSRGLLITETDEDGNVTNYGYVEGHLAFCSTGSADQVQEIVFFLRSSADGSLMAVREGETIRFVNDSYIFQNNELLHQVAEDLVVSGDYEVLDDGMIRYEKNGASYIYSPSGLLMSVELNGVISEYFYDARTLVKVETTDGSVRSIENYRDGKAFEKLVYENGVLASLTEYRSGGNVQYLYRDGRRIAAVYYRQDNRTVDRIEYD